MNLSAQHLAMLSPARPGSRLGGYWEMFVALALTTNLDWKQGDGAPYSGPAADRARGYGGLRSGQPYNLIIVSYCRQEKSELRLIPDPGSGFSARVGNLTVGRLFLQILLKAYLPQVKNY
jgi:hypothetical protein